jgi:[CysO sulfur-carrier protein]-S-L-cysteine hydrolase
MTRARRAAIDLPADIEQGMLAWAYACHPEEACGLLAGLPRGGLRMAYPLTNAQHSPTRYTIDPTEHFRALRHAERQGWELVGAFHSHPDGEASPSETDVRLAAEPDWLYVVIGMADARRPSVRAFHIRSGSVTEVELVRSVERSAR